MPEPIFEAVTAATTLTVSGPLSGAFAGTLFLQGAGTGSFTAAATINLPSATLRKSTASLWAVNSANNALAGVTVDAGALRVGAANALGSTAVATLGQAGTVADLDLNGRNQAVGGLATASTDALVDPAGNRIGIGNLVAGPGVESTLTYGGAVSSYKGTLVNSLTAATGRTLSLTVQSGSLTLGATNIYTGPTLITGGTLGLTTVTGIVGGVTNNGAIANSSSVTLNAGAARLDVTGLAGGANPGPSSDGTPGRFLVAANQTLQGIGTSAQGGGVIGGVTVSPLGTLRGGVAGSVANPLTVTGGVELRGGPAGLGGGQLVIDLNNTAASGTPVGRVAAGAAFNLNTLATPGPVVIKLQNDLGLVNGTSYNYAVAAAVGGFQLNGTPLGAGVGYTYLTDFTLATDRPQTGSFQGVTLIPDGGNNLILTFTPVPEPATVLGLAAAGLGAVRLARRRILAG